MINETISIYVTTLIRYKQYGYIYNVSFPKRIQDKVEVKNQTEIAQHGGPHGLDWSEHLLVTGTYDDVRFYNRSIELVNRFTHKFISGVHGISVYEGKVWVSSCNNEAVMCFSSSGRLEEVHFLEENKNLMGLLGKDIVSVSRITDYRNQQRPYKLQPFHVNDVQRTEDGLEVSLHKLGMVYDLYNDKIIAEIESDDIHDGRSHGNVTYINNTGKQAVVRLAGNSEPDRECKIDIMQIASSSTKFKTIAQKAQFKVIRTIKKAMPNLPFTSPSCSANWLRGLCLVDDNHVLVGTSPAAICLINIEEEKVVNHIQLSNNLCEAVFAIVVDRSNIS